MNVDDEEQMLIDENRRLLDAKTCKVCMDKEVNTVFLPCGHLVSNDQCAPKLRNCRAAWGRGTYFPPFSPFVHSRPHPLLFFYFLPCCMECRCGLAMRKLSVHLSLRLSFWGCVSVKRVDCDKTEERTVQIFIPYEKLFSLVFREEKWLVRGDFFYLKFWVNRPPLERNCRFWTDKLIRL